MNELLREVMVNPEKNRSYELSDIIQHKKARKILLQAHLAKLITDRILTRPFHYIEDDVHKTMEPDDSNINGHYMQTFDNFYTNLMKGWCSGLTTRAHACELMTWHSGRS